MEDMQELQENREEAQSALRQAAMQFTGEVAANSGVEAVTRASRALETAARQFAAIELLMLSASLDTIDEAKREARS